MAIRITGINSGMDTDAMVQELVSAYEKKGQKTKNEKTKLEWTQEKWTDLNKKIKSFSTKINNLKYTGNYASKKTVSSDESKVSVIAGDNAVKGIQNISIDKLATTAYVTSGEITKTDGGSLSTSTKLSELGITATDSKIKLTSGGREISIDANADTTIGQLVSKLKSAGVEASFDSNNSRLFISAKKSGAEGDFSFSSEDAGVLDALGLGSTASVIRGEDAEITLNGAKFTNNTNVFDINGMTITAKDVTNGKTVQLQTDTDTDAIYKKIKDMISEYSSLINEMSKLYNAESASKYDPLTDEEKDAMTDEEVEKWETKIKDSLLRRDSSLSQVMNAMKASSLKSYEVNGKKMSLSDFGIATLGYFNAADNEKSALHINGDEDDEAVSGKENKLMQMITKDPDAVAEFFSKYMSDMANQFRKMTSSSDYRSYGNFYNDKKVKSDLSKYETKISDWEDYVEDIEDRYYSQFSKMETQLAKLNSTQSSISSYFGS